MRKVMTIVGTRPELIKMSRVIVELDQCTEHVLVHSGQNYDYELNEVFFEDLGIRKPDYFLGVAGQGLAESIANVIVKSDKIFELVKPDALLLYGDTNTCLSVIPAKRRKIPIFHMEAGNRCFDQRVPEEQNRKIVDHLSDVNMVLTEHARRYLISEGVRPELIFKTGSHLKEVINTHFAEIQKSNILKKENLEVDKYFVVSAHREENVDDEVNLKAFVNTLYALVEEYQMPLVLSVHPRTRKRLESLESKINHPLIKLKKPFGYFDYLKLQMSAYCVLSDSGTITEETSLLNLPSIMLRNAHERPEGVDVGTLIMSGLDSGRVLDAIQVVRKQFSRDTHKAPVVLDYEASCVSKTVVRIVLSYIDYINRTVWSK